jgi:apolipoprotein N-acyltransferase
MAVWQYVLLALIAGGLMPFAYAPFDLYPLSLIGLTLLFYLWSQATATRAFWYGLLFGLAMFGGGVSWVFISIHDYGHVPLLLSVLLTGLFITILALFPALCGYIAVRLRTHLKLSAISAAGFYGLLVLPPLWVACEWLRGWFMTGFPWLNLGYAFTDAPLAGYAPILGVYGVSLMAAISCGLLLQMLFNQLGQVDGRAFVALITVWAIGGFLSGYEWTSVSSEPLRVSHVQGNIPQDLKWLSDMRQPTLAHYMALSREHWESDLIIWPETAIPMFNYQAESYLDSIRAEAILNATALLVGIVYQNPVTGAYYNSMLGLDDENSRYDKRHLVPFTEYLPLKSLLTGVVDFLDVPMSDFSAGGDTQATIRLAGQDLGVTICFEDAFGEDVISSLPQASLLVNVSNDAWFAGSIAPAQHLQMARMRALESGRELMRATNTGITAFIGVDGRLRQVAPEFASTVLTADVQPRKGATPYAIIGNAGALLLSIMMLGFVWLRRRKATP